MLVETGKAQKEAIQTGASHDWRPAWMHVPPARLLDGAASGPADQWDRVSHPFEDDAAEEVVREDSVAA